MFNRRYWGCTEGLRRSSAKKHSLLLAGNGSRRVWEVAGSGAHTQLVVALSPGIDVHHSISAQACRFAGMIANRVLVPDVTRHLSRYLVDLTKILREEGESSGLIGEQLQRP